MAVVIINNRSRLFFILFRGYEGGDCSKNQCKNNNNTKL